MPINSMNFCGLSTLRAVILGNLCGTVFTSHVILGKSKRYFLPIYKHHIYYQPILCNFLKKLHKMEFTHDYFIAQIEEKR